MGRKPKEAAREALMKEREDMKARKKEIDERILGLYSGFEWVWENGLYADLQRKIGLMSDSKKRAQFLGILEDIAGGGSSLEPQPKPLVLALMMFSVLGELNMQGIEPFSSKTIATLKAVLREAGKNGGQSKAVNVSKRLTEALAAAAFDPDSVEPVTPRDLHRKWAVEIREQDNHTATLSANKVATRILKRYNREGLSKPWPTDRTIRGHIADLFPEKQRKK